MSGSSDTPRRNPEHRFITQETRYAIIQAILGHPEHLVTLDELEYLISKNRSTIREHLDCLAEKDIVAEQSYDESGGGQSVPREFWMLTRYGITLLDDYDYLRYVPVLRALQDNISLTEKMERHRNVPRPDLPADVSKAFTAPELDTDTQAALDEGLAACEESGIRLFNGPAVGSNQEIATHDGADSPFDELF